MIRKNRVLRNKFTVPYFNKLNGEIYGGNSGTRSNFTVPYSEKNSFITASSRFFRFSSGVLWLSYISDYWTDPPDFTYTFTKNRLTRLWMLQVTALGPIPIGLYSKEQGIEPSPVPPSRSTSSPGRISVIRHVHHEHIHAHAADNRTDMTANGFSPCFYSKAFLMSHSLQTVNLFCTLFFCLFRPDRSSRL